MAPHATAVQGHQRLLLLRGTVVNRTYGTHKNLPGMYLPIFTNNIRSYLLWSPVIVVAPDTEAFVVVPEMLAVATVAYQAHHEHYIYVKHRL